ncbi:MAG: helix-turn-helix transcriptional regulator [Muribaculaceae bacterium]
MDIVTRIKLFLNTKGIAVSQFADACDIPRPTVSQLLNGRNKKVSDEIISKIHITYPTLSIMWLMFGDEPMCLSKSTLDIDIPKNTPGANDGLFDESALIVNNGTANDNNETLSALNGQNTIVFDDLITSTIANKAQQSTNNGLIAQTIEKITKDVERKKNDTKSNILGKEIVNIMVFYSDNSFESFTR